jgi:hypothetical protein
MIVAINYKFLLFGTFYPINLAIVNTLGKVHQKVCLFLTGHNNGECKLGLMSNFLGYNNGGFG